MVFRTAVRHACSRGKFLLSEEARKWVTVVLTGEGADEVFLGYRRVLRASDPRNPEDTANSNSSFLWCPSIETDADCRFCLGETLAANVS